MTARRVLRLVAWAVLAWAVALLTAYTALLAVVIWVNQGESRRNDEAGR